MITNTIRSASRFVLLVLTVALIGSTGCSSKGPKNSVTGMVTLNDKPVSGTVEFIGSDGKSESVPLANGKYITHALTPGTFKVVVKGTNLPGRLQGQHSITLPEMPGMEGGPAGVEPPAKYADPNLGGLTFEFTGGQVTHNIPLQP